MATAQHDGQPTVRLMIKEMVLDNFKSYAGPQSVGPFHKSFSSVVGPNGSGKSNVIDALLFVFGRRAKQLRFNKVSELIHNSSNFQNLEMAKVTVHFQQIIDLEGDKYEVVPNSEFSIARTAHRNNSSDYYINDRKVSCKEVTDKLKALGVDLDNNRFLILQGEVEQISMMRPKAEDKNDTGLLEYLEDIIGTQQLVAPIEEAAKQLEEMNDNRQGLIQRLKIAEKEKEALEGKKAEAELFLNKQCEMLLERVYGNTIYITDTQATLASLDVQKGELEAKLKHEKEKGANHAAEATAAEKEYEVAEKAAKECQQALENAETSFKDFERKDAKLQIEIKDLADKMKKLDSKMTKDVDAAKKAKIESAKLQEEAPRAQEQLATLQQELAAAEASLEAQHESLRGEIEGYHQQLSQVRSTLAPWEKKIGEATGRISVAASEKETLQRRTQDAKKRLDAALKSLASAKANSEARAKHIADLEASAEHCKSDIEANKKELAKSRKVEAEKESIVRELRDKVAGLHAEMQNASTSASGLMTNLMTARARGELTGIIGRLGDLGAIDAKYDVAVSTAVGALDYIVVETTTDAQRCVEHLRKNNLGVATCLILDKQQHLAKAAAEKVDTPEGIPRLYDLIKVKDAKLRPAFYMACGNTLVANDLDQAARIAYNDSNKRFKRVVTLQGQLIAESGTMSGGAGRPQRGRMALGSSAPKGSGSGADAKALAADLKKAEQELEAANAELRQARDRCEACEKAVKASEAQLAELELAAPKARMEAQAEAEKANDIKQRLDDLRAATQVNEEEEVRIKELEKAIAREEKEVQRLREQTEGLNNQAKALQASIDNAGGERLKSARAAVAKLQKDIADLEADISKKAVQLKASLKLVDKVSKDQEKDAKERTRLEQESEKKQSELQQMEEQALNVMQLREQTKEKLDIKQKELEVARTQLREVNTKHAIIRKTELEIETKLEDYRKYYKEESAKIEKWEDGIQKYKKKMMELSGGDEPMIDATSLQGHKAEEHVYKASVIEAELEKMNPDMDAIEAYRAKAADYDSRAKQLDDATKQRDETRKKYEALRKQRLDTFMAGFNIISMKLKEMYQMLTLGGDAELELVDSLDPFSEGIVFSVRPPKKSWKNISNLSGGEKTLSSLSLVFALHHFKPTPLYVMDEIDAALDFKNVSIVAHYIKERTRNAQFVIISLRNNMFELADRLVGIYKTDNTTKTVTIEPAKFVIQPATTSLQQHQKQHIQQQQHQTVAPVEVA